jgi:predicted CxxxxCH...CXXCH cytochrome family protein
MTRKSAMIAGVLATVSLGSLAFAQAQSADTGAAAQAAAAPTTTIQPIAFPHSIHAGTYKMDCMYCHFSAERSVDAGLPPVATCAGCHRLIQGTAHPEEVQKVIGYATRGEAIPWVRVYKVADHVHFPHMRHVNAGLACQECHGPVETMGAIEERDPAWPGNNMGKCVSCHVERGARRDCAVCHY